MENLQKIHVKLARMFVSSDYRSKHRVTLYDLTSTKNFVPVLKKRLRFYQDLKQSYLTSRPIEMILKEETPESITEIIFRQPYEIRRTLTGILVHAYILFRQGIDITEISTNKYLDKKKTVLKNLSRQIADSKYNIGLCVWGSYVMRDTKFSTFSDMDLVLIVDDSRLGRKNDLLAFLEFLFHKLDHYNLPSSREIKWFAENTGIARCGFISDGVFGNLKIISKDSLNSATQIFCESLKQNSSTLPIRSFTGRNVVYTRDGTTSVYPIIETSGRYEIARGVLVDFLHTSKPLAASNSKLRLEIKSIRYQAIAKSMELVHLYCPSLRNENNVLLNLSGTSPDQFDHTYTSKLSLIHNYAFNRFAFRKPYIISFLYAEVALPLVSEVPKHYWKEKNLLAFFLGVQATVPTKDLSQRNRVFSRYFSRINYLRDELLKEDIEKYAKSVGKIIERGRISQMLAEIESRLGRTDLIVVITSLLDLFERTVADRSLYHDIFEAVFKELFPSEYLRSNLVLQTVVKNLNGHAGINKFKRSLEVGLVGKEGIVHVTYRIRRPAGLLRHCKMNAISLDKVNDIVSFQVHYLNLKDSSFEDVCASVEKSLYGMRLRNLTKSAVHLEDYSGCHFYFTVNSCPLEVVVRDLRSNTTIIHKTEHSVRQKEIQRLKAV